MDIQKLISFFMWCTIINAIVLAFALGAIPTGLDFSSEMIRIARDRNPLIRSRLCQRQWFCHTLYGPYSGSQKILNTPKNK